MAITNDDINLFVPNFYNMELAKSKGLADENGFNDTYYFVLSAYYEYLNDYLSDELELPLIENGIDAQDKYFMPAKEENKDVYQSMSKNKYFYARNTLYLENLMKTDIEEIINAATNKDKKKMYELIVKTLKTVITPSTEDKERFTNFGPAVSAYMCDQESLVIGLRFAEENELGLDDAQWDESYNKRRVIINSIMAEAPEEWAKALNIKCKIIEYDAGSVKKKITQEHSMGGK